MLQRRLHGRAVLTRGFFEREYITAGKTLRQISAETGYPCQPMQPTSRGDSLLKAMSLPAVQALAAAPASAQAPPGRLSRAPARRDDAC